jgi:CarD family transcriptional regulator
MRALAHLSHVVGLMLPKAEDADSIAATRAQAGSHDRSQPPEPSKTRFGFKANDFVVHPAHGVGQILAIEEQTVAGASLEFFVVYFAKSKMTLRVPTRRRK